MSDATTAQPTSAAPRHIAIIMDGNGRWAKQRGLSRHAGHRAGVENIRQIIRAAADIGVQFLTLYAFSTENWRRPSLEVQGLMTLLGEFLDREVDNLRNENVRIVHLGTFDGVMPISPKKSARQWHAPVTVRVSRWRWHSTTVGATTSCMPSKPLWPAVSPPAPSTNPW